MLDALHFEHGYRLSPIDPINNNKKGKNVAKMHDTGKKTLFPAMSNKPFCC